MLRQRILTAVGFGLALLVVLLWLPAGVAQAVFALAILVGAWEWSRFPGWSTPAARLAYVSIVALAMVAVWRISATAGSLPDWLLWTASVWWALAFIWMLAAPAAHNRLTAAVAGLLVLVPAWAALAHLYGAPSAGPHLVLFLLLLVWAADIGAFFAGRNFGRLKLAPRVSPSKTWEGVLGGIAAGGLIAALGAWWFGQPPLAFMSLCCAVVLVSIVGDLTESMFKRYAGVKDSGVLFPGHGGLLDRIDSVTAAAPMFLLGLRWLGVAA